MLTIWFATTNPGKVRSAQRRLEPHGITLYPTTIELDEQQINDPEIIASKKAEQAYRQLQKPVMVIDAAWDIEALRGFPGPYAKYVFETIGVEGILQLLKPQKKQAERLAKFVHVLAFQDGTMQQAKIFTGIVRGSIARSVRGGNTTYGWSDAIRIFIPDGWKKTQGEMNDEEQLAFRTQTGQYYNDFAVWYKQHIEAIQGRRSPSLAL